MIKYFTHEKELTKEQLKKLLYNIGLNEEILQKEEMNIIRNKLDKYIESLSYNNMMEYLDTQGLRGITLPVYEGKTSYECLCEYVKQVMLSKEHSEIPNLGDKILQEQEE